VVDGALLGDHGSAEGHGSGGSEKSTNGAGYGGGNHNGRGVAGDAVSGGRRPPGPTARPAFIVLLVAVAMFVLGAVATGLSGGSAPPTAGNAVASVPGSPLPAMAARGALKPITSAGLPPDDVLDATVLPQGAAVIGGTGRNLGVELYDKSLDFRIPQPQQTVIDFYRAQLPAQGWQILTQGPPVGAASGIEVLAKHPSGDGYYWELGVVVAPTTFGPGASTGTTRFTVRLFAVGDEG
jgi:hypothetical protein